MSLSIPQPPAYPIIGNIGDIDPQNGMQSLIHLAEKYGGVDSRLPNLVLKVLTPARSDFQVILLRQ